MSHIFPNFSFLQLKVLSVSFFIWNWSLRSSQWEPPKQWSESNHLRSAPESIENEIQTRARFRLFFKKVIELIWVIWYDSYHLMILILTVSNSEKNPVLIQLVSITKHDKVLIFHFWSTFKLYEFVVLIQWFRTWIKISKSKNFEVNQKLNLNRGPRWIKTTKVKWIKNILWNNGSKIWIWIYQNTCLKSSKQKVL